MEAKKCLLNKQKSAKTVENTEKTSETEYTICKRIYRVPRKMLAGDEGVSARRL